MHATRAARRQLTKGGGFWTGHVVLPALALVLLCLGTATACNCTRCSEAGLDASKCCEYRGIPAAVLAFEEDGLWVPRLEEFNDCTGASVIVTYTPLGDELALQTSLPDRTAIRSLPTPLLRR